jgi:hypothetical protein
MTHVTLTIAVAASLMVLYVGSARALAVYLTVLVWQAAYQGRLWARTRTLKVTRIPTSKYRGFDLFKLWRSELSIRERIQSSVSTIKRLFVKQLCQRHDPTALIVKQEVKRD